MRKGTAVEQVRKQTADALSDVKAYELPAVCKRYGLPDGTDEEAFRGKFRYVSRRLAELSAADVIRVGHAVLDDFPRPALSEALAKAEELARRRISEITRRRIIHDLDSINVEGRLHLVELLEPVIPLDEIASVHPLDPFGPTETIRNDIYRHCINNPDWTNADLLVNLGLLTCSQKRFFTFLERIMHPLVREEVEQLALLKRVNRLLSRDGFALCASDQISGYNTYVVREVGLDGTSPAEQGISERLERFDEAGIKALWEKALRRRGDDPEGAITIARTFLERCCKHILDELAVDYPDDADLPKLWALCAERLNLAPSQHTEDVFRRILGNCQSVVNYLGTIRNRLGDSHGQKGRPVRPKPRHAELVVNLAGSMAMFLLETWIEHQEVAAQAQRS